LDRLAVADAAGRLDDLAQRDPVRVLVDTGLLDVTRQAEQAGSWRICRANRRVLLYTEGEDRQHIDQGLDVVDRCGFAEDTVRHRERGLVPRLTALALDRVDTRTSSALS